MLGPVRFEHIVHVAADALATYHLSKRPAPGEQLTSPPRLKAHMPLSPPLSSSSMQLSPGKPQLSPGKTQLSSPGTDDKSRILRVLRAKDMTITTLRATITAQKVQLGETTPSASPVKDKHYERLGEEGLSRLVHARDKTIHSLRDMVRELQAKAQEAVAETAGEDIDVGDML